MKYTGLPCLLWTVFHGSFTKHLTLELGLTVQQAAAVEPLAKAKYREIIAGLPEFEKGDRFAMNIVSCAQLAAYVLCLPQRPEVGPLTDFYANAMMTPVLKVFCRISGKNTYTAKNEASLQATAAFRAADRNPYSWNMDYFAYPDGSGHEARFTRCGIFTLMQELGLGDLTPALCHFDYDMAEAAGATTFVRQYTLASGGPYCDCGYHKKEL